MFTGTVLVLIVLTIALGGCWPGSERMLVVVFLLWLTLLGMLVLAGWAVGPSHCLRQSSLIPNLAARICHPGKHRPAHVEHTLWCILIWLRSFLVR